MRAAVLGSGEETPQSATDLSTLPAFGFGASARSYRSASLDRHLGYSQSSRPQGCRGKETSLRPRYCEPEPDVTLFFDQYSTPCRRGLHSSALGRSMDTISNRFASTPATNYHRIASNKIYVITHYLWTPATLLSFGGVTIPAGCRRIFVTAELESSNGDPRIQPTGFPDIGPVLYPDPAEEDGLICLIESEASMANWLEAVCLAPINTRGHSERNSLACRTSS